MEKEVLYQVSLIAAFVAGMVALFAPCCISYLLPAYFGNIFKERRRILFMTLVYSLGIFLVMLPVVLGARGLFGLFFRLHDQLYFLGGIFLLAVSLISLLGIKLPMPKIGLSQRKYQNDIFSTFTLGIFSGITSACCAPVLVGVITLSTLSPTIFQSLLVGIFYVLGMVAPLYLASLFIEKGNILEKPFFRQKLTVLSLGGRAYPIFLSNLVAFVIFFLSGGLTLILLSAGKLGMPAGESSVIKTINKIAITLSKLTSSFSLLDFVFAAFLLYLLWRFIKKVSQELTDF